jgi:hypothetical protein
MFTNYAKGWNEDDQLGQVGMPNLGNILSGCGLADGGRREGR